MTANVSSRLLVGCVKDKKLIDVLGQPEYFLALNHTARQVLLTLTCRSNVLHFLSKKALARILTVNQTSQARAAVRILTFVKESATSSLARAHAKRRSLMINLTWITSYALKMALG